MEELKELIALLADTPMFVTWVLIGYLVYKLAVIGSIYGLIKFVATRGFDYLRDRATAPEYKEVRPMLDRIAMTGCADMLIEQVKRTRGQGNPAGTACNYVWHDDVKWLRKAIDNQIAADEAARKAKEK